MADAPTDTRPAPHPEAIEDMALRLQACERRATDLLMQVDNQRAYIDRINGHLEDERVGHRNANRLAMLFAALFAMTGVIPFVFNAIREDVCENNHNVYDCVSFYIPVGDNGVPRLTIHTTDLLPETP